MLTGSFTILYITDVLKKKLSLQCYRPLFSMCFLLQGRQNIRAAGKRSSVFFYHYILVAAPGGRKGRRSKVAALGKPSLAAFPSVYSVKHPLPSPPATTSGLRN